MWVSWLRSEQVRRQHRNRSGLSTTLRFPTNCVATFGPLSHHRRIHQRPHRAALVRYQKGRDTTRLMSPAHFAEPDHPKIDTKKSTPNVVEQRQSRSEIVQLDNREGPRQRLPRADLICSPQVWRVVSHKQTLAWPHGDRQIRILVLAARKRPGFARTLSLREQRALGMPGVRCAR